MKTLRKVECKWCHAVFTTDDGRLKYCCPECYEESHRAQARKNYRIRYETHREEECARQRKYNRTHPEKMKATRRAWEQKNVERRCEYKHDWYIARKEAAAQ